MSLSELLKPIQSPTPTVQVTDAELARYADLIYQRTGIHVSPHKKTLLSNRLRRRLRDTGIATFDQYFRHLQRLGHRRRGQQGGRGFGRWPGDSRLGHGRPGFVAGVEAGGQRQG